MNSNYNKLIDFIYNRNISANQIKFMFYLLKDAVNNEFNIEDVTFKFELLPAKFLKDVRNFQYIPNCFEYRVNEKSITFKIFEFEYIMFLNKKNNKILVKKEEDNLLEENIEQVFNLWAKLCDSPRSKLDAKRKTIIKTAINNYGLEIALKAVEGCSKTLWNMGYGFKGEPTDKKYIELSLIFRDAEKVERFTSNSFLPTLEEQLESLKKKGVSTGRERVDVGIQDDWLNQRLNELENIKK